MTRKLIAGVTAAAMALGVGASPAQAADAEKIALWLLGVAAVAAVIDNAEAKPAPKRQTTPRYGAITPRYDHGRRIPPPHSDRWNGSRHPHRSYAKVLPSSCLRAGFEIGSRQRKAENFVSSQCLARRGVTPSLPRSCKSAYVNGRYRYQGYELSCLRQKGYSVRARR